MRVWIVIVLVTALAAPAFADATADATAHDEAFAKACTAGDVKAAVALYADDAFVIWPGVGEEAHDKAGIEKLAAELCDPKTNPKLVLKSDVGVQLDESHISIIGKWELTQTDPHGKRTTSQIRVSEIIAKTPAGWRYIVDHASIGVPAPKATKTHAR